MLGIQTTDAYQSFAILAKNIQVFQTGNVPFGEFWLPDFYGGAVATYFHVSIIPEVSHTSLLAINVFANDLVLSLKIYALITLVAAQVLSFKLANHYVKNHAIAWVLSIGYSFSTFYLSQCNDGHCNFLAGAALLPGVLLLFEKVLTAPNRKYMFYASFALIALFFADLQILIFTIYFLLFRAAFHLFVNKNQICNILGKLVQVAVVFSLFVAPFLVSFVMFQNTDSLSVSEIPSYYLSSASEIFSRNMGTTLTSTQSTIYSLYIGVALFILAIIPTVLFRALPKQDRQNYRFHLFIFVFFVLIAIGTVFASFVTAFFVRVPSRSILLIDLSVCICAGYGLLALSNFSKNKFKITRLLKNKKLTTLFAIGLACMVYVDLTGGMYPVTTSVPELNGADQFVQSQKEDFRVLKYPVLWAYTNYESAVIGHEILGESVIALRSYPSENGVFLKLINEFNSISNLNQPEVENFTLLSTICAVKYVLVNTTAAKSAAVTDYFDNSLQYFRQAYSDDNSAVYENLYFRGKAFAIKTDEQLHIDNLTLTDFTEKLDSNATVNFTQDFNHIKLSGNLSQPVYIVISQAYNPFWVQANNGTAAFTKCLNVTAYQADRGAFKVEAIFSAADQTSNLYVVFAIALFLCCAALGASSFGRKGWLQFTLGLSTAFGAIVMLLAFMATGYAPQSLRMLGIFSGVFNNVLLLFGIGIVVISVACLIRSQLLLASKKTLAAISLFLRDSKPKGTVQKLLFCVILITSLALIVSAFYSQATRTDIMRPQLQTITDKQTETYVSIGTQFSLSGSGTALLTGSLIMFAGLGLAVGYQLYSEIKSGMLTTKVVEFLGLIGLSAALVFVIGNGGLMASADLINNQLVGLFAVVFSLVIMEFALTLYRPVVLFTVSVAKKKLGAAGEVSGLLLKTLLAVSFFFILLVNVASAVPEGLTWLDNNMAFVMGSILILYVLSQGIYSVGHKTGFSAASLDSIKPDSGVKRLHLGIFGGIIGVFLAGVLMRVLTLQTQSVVVSALVICAALGGLGFGALTNGNKKLRGIIGCIFGSIAIIFGLVMTYTSPIIIGYSLDGTPLYKWHGASFGEFMGNQLLSLQGAFYLLLGLMLAYLAAAYLSYRVKAKRE